MAVCGTTDGPPDEPALGPSYLLDFVLRALQALKPCDPRISDITRANTITQANTISWTNTITQTKTITWANTITLGLLVTHTHISVF